MAEWLESVRTLGFGQPLWLGLLFLLISLWRVRSRASVGAAVTFSSIRLLRGIAQPVVNQRQRRAWQLRGLVIGLIIVALARPRVERGVDEDFAEGIDILLVLDASRSMDTKDFEFQGEPLSRREALLRVMKEFIAARPRDRIGVVGFAEKPFLVSPLTLDHSWMLEAMAEVQPSLGTAIGSGVEAAVDLLRQSESADKIVIVVTDGLNTSGTQPMDAARLARRFGVRVYSIGIVSYADMATGALDDLTLSRMARLTGGQFFQAADGSGLQAIYRQIDQLERQQFKQPRLRAWRELFAWPAVAAIALVLGEIALTYGRRLRLP